jgi:prepilin-type N-terminal cleavage/methylation domain-containing protein
MKKRNRHGFTLIEIIAVLLLLGILAASVMISLAPMVQGLAQVQTNTETAQKARLAMARISRELTTITNISAAGALSMTYQFLVPAGLTTYATWHHTLAWSGVPGQPVTLQGVPLVDQVHHFALSLSPGPPLAIDVELALDNRYGIDTFISRVIPRNIPEGAGP